MDSTGFDEFFRREYPLLVGFLRKSGFKREEAEDAAGEAMRCAYVNWLKISSPEAWVRTAAHRIACKQVERARKEFRRAIGSDLFDTIHYDSDVVQINEENDLIQQLLNELPPKQRLVMAWRLDGFDNNEIANQLEMLPATVASNLRHARDKLKAAYQKKSPGPQYATSDEGME